MKSLKVQPVDIDHVLWLLRIFQKLCKARGALARELESKMADAYSNPLGFTVIESFAASRILQVRCSKVVQEAEVSAEGQVGAAKDGHTRPFLGTHESSDEGAVFGDPAEDPLEEHRLAHEPLWKGPVSTDVTFSLTEIVTVLQKVARKHRFFREIGRSVIRELVELSWLKQNHKPGPKSGDDDGS